jgi:hypothetical protein
MGVETLIAAGSMKEQADLKSHKMYTLGSYTQALSYLLRVTKNIGAPKEAVYIS